MKPNQLLKWIFVAVTLFSLGAISPAARAQDVADGTHLADGTPWYSWIFGGVQPAVNCTNDSDGMERCTSQGLNNDSQLTFRAPIMLPGNTVLSPGTYRFTLAEPDVNRNIVQVFNEKGSIVASMVTIPTSRDKETEQTQLSLAQSTNHQPDALLKWFAPGELTGHEFLYDRNQERKFSEAPTVNVVAQPARG